MSVVNAAVAVLQDASGRVLLAQRPEGKGWAGWWEFPGGKIEQGESAQQALSRELMEELGMQVVQAYPWLTREHAYPEKTVRLHFFMVRDWQGEPQSLENQRWSWQDPANIEVSPLLPANQAIIDALRLPSIYAISNVCEMGEQAFLEALQYALEHGLKILQVREKQMSPSALGQLLSKVCAMAAPYNAKILLNANAEMATDFACGLHLDSQQLRNLSQRPTGLCGASCHNQQELQLAWQWQLDYALLSPVQSTLSHPDAQPLGWEVFSQLIHSTPIPIYALGGMHKDDLTQAWRSGAHGIAMQRGIWNEV